MKVLLDECVDQKFRHEIVGHDVFTAPYLGWDGVKNGQSLATAAAAGFAGMVTNDRGIEHQQNRYRLPLTVFRLHSPTNDLPDLVKFTHNVLAALASLPATPSVVHVWS